MRKIPISLQWKRFREANLLSQQDLATAIGIGLRTYQYIESGQTNPRPSTVAKFKSFQSKMQLRRYDRRQLQKHLGQMKRAEIADFQIATERIENDSQG